MGVATELVVVGGWDCVLVVLDLLGKIGAGEMTGGAEGDCGGGWVNWEGRVSEG